MRNNNTNVTLVTGGTGLIGGEVILELARAGHRVRAIVRGQSHLHAKRRLLDRLEKSDAYRHELMPRIEIVLGDTTEEGFGASAETFADVNRIIHCAANTQFSEKEDERVWNTNVSGAQHLVDAARAWAPSARVVFVSTASVTTAPERACIDEDAPFAGHSNTYTLSKREAERIVTASGLDAVILRPAIVLSRGVRDRAMARSILWAVPIMSELGDIPVDADARIDIVPVDYVAKATVQLALKPRLNHGRYYVTAGEGSRSFAELRDAVAARNPEFDGIRPVGRRASVSNRARARLLRPLNAYLPFINAGVCYSNDRLVRELGLAWEAPTPLSYVPQLVSQITLREAFEEMHKP